MKKKLLHLLIAFMPVAACTSPYGETDLSMPNDAYADFQHVYWLTGNWRMENDEGITSEHWVIQNDSTLKGKSSFRIGKDTISSEEMILQQRQGVITYNPTVRGENGGRAVVFTMTEWTDTFVAFENTHHDFPQRITYARVGRDSLYAEISGKQLGKMKRIGFPYKRVAYLP